MTLGEWLACYSDLPIAIAGHDESDFEPGHGTYWSEIPSDVQLGFDDIDLSEYVDRHA